MMKRRKIFRCIAGAYFLWGTVLPAMGQAESLSEYQLEEIVVTATTTPVEEKKVNASITVITKEEIERQHYESLYDMLEHVTGVNSVHFSEGTGYEISGESSLTIRGSASCVVAVDGIVQRVGTGFRNHLTNMNMDDIERVEVLKGSASTLYGADAIGGVVNIITKRGGTRPKTRIAVEGGVFGHQKYHLSHVGGDGNSYWALSADQRNKGDYKDGHGVNLSRELESHTFDIKYGYHLSDSTDFIFKVQDMRQNMDWVQIMPTWTRVGTGHLYLTYLTGIVDYKRSDGKEANLFAVYQGRMANKRMRSSKTSHGVPLAWEDSKTDSVTVTERYYRQLTDSNRIAAGLEFAKNGVSPTIMHEFSAYVQDEWDISEKFKLTGGIRYVRPSQYANKTLGSLNLSYAPTGNMNFYVSVNQFYKAPSPKYVFGNAFFIPNPGIKAEDGYTEEIGANIDLDKRTTLDFALFRRSHGNAIVIDGVKHQYVNIGGTSRVHGMEINLRRRWGRFFHTALGYSGITADNNSQIPRLAKSQIVVGLTYDHAPWDIGLQGINRFDIVPNNYFPAGYGNYLPTKNYWVWNLSANYHLRDDLKLYARVNNLFNQPYMAATQYFKDTDDISYMAAEGRSFILGLEYSF